MPRTRWRGHSWIVGIALALAGISVGALSTTSWIQQEPETAKTLRQETNHLVDQTKEALTFALFAWDALNRDDRESSITNAHRAINVIEGPDGQHYEPEYGTPADGIGNGTGALVHANRVSENINVMPQGANYKLAAENAVLFLRWAVGHMRQGLNQLEAQNPSEALQSLRQGQAMLMAALGSREEVDQPTHGSARAVLAWLQDRN